MILPLLLDLTEVDFFFNDCSPSEIIDTSRLQKIENRTRSAYHKCLKINVLNVHYYYERIP